MEIIGTIVTWIMMICCVIGGISYAIDDQSELGQAFLGGLNIMASMFIFLNIPMLDEYLAKRYTTQFDDYAAKTKKFFPFIY